MYLIILLTRGRLSQKGEKQLLEKIKLLKLKDVLPTFQQKFSFLKVLKFLPSHQDIYRRNLQ